MTNIDSSPQSKKPETESERWLSVKAELPAEPPKGWGLEQVNGKPGVQSAWLPVTGIARRIGRSLRRDNLRRWHVLVIDKRSIHWLNRYVDERYPFDDENVVTSLKMRIEVGFDEYTNEAIRDHPDLVVTAQLRCKLRAYQNEQWVDVEVGSAAIFPETTSDDELESVVLGLLDEAKEVAKELNC